MEILLDFVRLALDQPERFHSASDALFELVTEEDDWVRAAVKWTLEPTAQSLQKRAQQVARLILAKHLPSVVVLGSGVRTVLGHDVDEVAAAVMVSLGRPLEGQHQSGLDVLMRVGTQVMQAPALGAAGKAESQSTEPNTDDNFLLRLQRALLDADRGFGRLLAVIQHKRVSFE